MRTPLAVPAVPAVLAASAVLAVLAVLVVAPTRARAEPSLDAVLEERVTAELAADGVVLARHQVSLDVESVGDQLIISLIDPATGRAVASTKLATLPADREAAVATVTQLAASLVAQLSPGTAALDRERAERDRRDSAEAAYRTSALSFGDELLVSGDQHSTTTTRHWIVYQGELRRRLDPEQFYGVVGRPDLGARYRARTRRGIAAITTGGALVLAGGVYSILTLVRMDNCGTDDPDFAGCVDAEGDRVTRTIAIGLGVSLLGAAVGIAGIHYLSTAHPVSESEAQALAERYNTQLRRDLRLAPYATANGGGLVLGGRF
jgi:hypothetical protein